MRWQQPYVAIPTNNTAMRVWRNGSRMGLKIPGSRERGGSNPLTRTNYEELVEVVNMFDFEQNAMALAYYIQLIKEINKKHKMF